LIAFLKLKPILPVCLFFIGKHDEKLCNQTDNLFVERLLLCLDLKQTFVYNPYIDDVVGSCWKLGEIKL
jgi:hypothetical protein